MSSEYRKAGNQLKCCIVLLMLSLWAFADLFNSACEASESEQAQQTGEIIVNMMYDGHWVMGGSLTLYQLNQAGERALMCSVNTNGTVIFSGLEAGIYLVVQEEAAEGYKKIKPFQVTLPLKENGAYVYTINAAPKIAPDDDSEKPVLPPSNDDSEESLSPPYADDDADVIGGDANMIGRLPQTGQLYWPVPVLALLGLGFMTLGLIFYFKKRVAN